LKVREKVLAIAAHKLEANPADLVLEDGKIYVRGHPKRSVTFREIARIAHKAGRASSRYGGRT
jgi:carbon-monoxide dehydrogenase large subunit